MWSVRKGVAHWGNLPTSLGLNGPTLGQWKDKSSVWCEHLRVMWYHCTHVTTPFQPSLPCTSEFSHTGALIEGWASCLAAPCCPSQHPTPGRFPGQESTDDPFSQIQTRPWWRRASHLAVRYLWTEERLPLTSGGPSRPCWEEPGAWTLRWSRVCLNYVLLGFSTGSLAKTKLTLRKEIPQHFEYIDT